MTKGGFRPGSGRPPSGERKLVLVVKLRPKIANALRAAIPNKTRSAWIEKLIEDGLARLALSHAYRR